MSGPDGEKRPADVMAIAAEERREDVRRARTQAKRIAEPVVRDHLLEMADSLDQQADELLHAPQMIGRMR